MLRLVLIGMVDLLDPVSLLEITWRFDGLVNRHLGRLGSSQGTSWTSRSCVALGVPKPRPSSNEMALIFELMQGDTLHEARTLGVGVGLGGSNLFMFFPSPMFFECFSVLDFQHLKGKPGTAGHFEA